LTTPNANEDAAAKRRILCVSPVREHHPSLNLHLAKYRLQIVQTGLDAVRTYNAGAFDAYVLDYWLPDWSGLSLCRQIRKDDPFAPVVFFSSAEGDDQRKRAMRAGADAYLLASAGAEPLAAEVNTLLRFADVRGLRAKVEEELAIQEELKRRAALAVERTDHARALAAQALERAARARAQKAFMESGGTLGNFGRWWPQVFGSVSANHRLGVQQPGSDASDATVRQQQADQQSSSAT
jgi:DNA-binding response OmpR family regulator